MSTELEVKIIDIVGSPSCINPEDGEKVKKVITTALRADKPVAISLEGIEDFTSRFLNSAIGQLYGEFSEQTIRAKLRITHADKDDLALLKRVVERAKEYFKNPKRFEQACREVLGEDNE